MDDILSATSSHLPRDENLAERIIAQQANRRVQQVGAAVLFSMAGAAALVLIDGASKQPEAFRESNVPAVQTAAATSTPRAPTRSFVRQAFAEAAPIEAAGGEAPSIGARLVSTQTIIPPKPTERPAPTANEIAAATGAIPWQDPPTSNVVVPSAQETSSPAPAHAAAPNAQPDRVSGLPACVPSALQKVLSAVESRFHGVKVISTNHLHTGNHRRGSVREKLHLACKAIDIKTTDNPRQVMAFLHKRPEVGGVNAYRNHVIHFDLSAHYARSASRVASASARASR